MVPICEAALRDEIELMCHTSPHMHPRHVLVLMPSGSTDGSDGAFQARKQYESINVDCAVCVFLFSTSGCCQEEFVVYANSFYDYYIIFFTRDQYEFTLLYYMKFIILTPSLLLPVYYLL